MQPLRSAPTTHRSVWMWAGAAAGLALAVTMFLNSSKTRTPAAASRPPTETFVVSGAVLLGDSASFVRDDHGGCGGTGDHAGVKDGAPVLITTRDGFAGGKLTDARALTDGTCQFRFSVPRVPTGQDTYLLMVAGQDPRQYIEHELKSALLALRVD
ncbi:hypothetical protein [Micromonospora rubida]|uniref:hypothetical protein n=1 Tax=Micromonospora rubida TaxID=2697657 RepID=UPI00137809E6|nr:hypothetical protein [Micromonospora rubida]NBE81946.1 hypothetical protein [Micromonospora rubida]